MKSAKYKSCNYIYILVLILLSALVLRLINITTFDFTPDEALYSYISRGMSQGHFIISAYYHPLLTFLYPLSNARCMKKKVPPLFSDFFVLCRRSVGIFIHHPGIFLPLALVFYLPLILITLHYNLPLRAAYTFPLFQSKLLAGIIITFLNLLGLIACTLAVEHILQKKSPHTDSILLESFSRWKGATSTFLLLYGLLCVLFLLLIIPGIIYSIYWIFSLYIVVLTGTTKNEALKTSKKLTQKKFWEVIFTLFGLFLFTRLIPLLIAATGTVQVSLVIAALMVTRPIEHIFIVLYYCLHLWFII